MKKEVLQRHVSVEKGMMKMIQKKVASYKVSANSHQWFLRVKLVNVVFFVGFTFCVQRFGHATGEIMDFREISVISILVLHLPTHTFFSRKVLRGPLRHSERSTKTEYK